jgi:hypothetical protein
MIVIRRLSMDCGQTGCHCGPEVRFEEVLRWLDAVIIIHAPVSAPTPQTRAEPRVLQSDGSSRA